LELSSVGNVFEGGHNSGSYASDHISSFRSGWSNGGSGFSLYFYDNKCDDGKGTYTQTSANDWSTIDNRYGYNTSRFKVISAPLWSTGLTALSSSAVKTSVLANAGARPTDRDQVDSRVVNDALNGTGRIIVSQSAVGGWPTLAKNTRVLSLPANPHRDDDGDGYTNLEEWLHTLAAIVEGKEQGTLSSPKNVHIETSN
ncbi:hypothetical protein KAJ26_08050, partial [bacterium]|nr:hypothetical protein [bacterium]